MARYKMYVDGNLFYSPYSDSLNVLSAKVTLNQNAASTFEFQIPSTNTYINSFTRMSSAVTVYRDDVLLFSGIVCEDEIGWDNSKTIRCKDDLYRLSQSIMRPYCYGKSVDGTKIVIDANGDEQEVTTTTTETISVANFFKHLIANHNAMSSFKFAVGTVNVTGANVFESSSYTDTWSVISSLIDSYGGYIRLRYSGSINYIDWLTDFTDTSSQQIIYGENLLDYTSDTDGLDLATRLIPTGATIESTKIITVDGDEQEIPVSEVVTIKSVNGGLDYIQDSTAVSTYGVITVHQEWPEIEDSSALLTAAREYLKEIVYHTRNITIKAVDMISVDEYQTAFAMHKYIRVISSPHNIDDLYLPMTMEIDLFNPANNTIDLSTTTTTSTGSSEVRSARSASGGFVSSVTKNLNTLQDNVNANKGTFNDLKAKSATFEDLKAVNAEIETLSAEKADIADLEANYAHITNGVIDNATIDHASVNGLSANYATITNLNAQKARIDTIASDYVNTATLEAQKARIDVIEGDYATLTELHTDYIDAETIDATYVDTATLEADYITASDIDATYATIANLNAQKARIDTIESDYVHTATLEAQKARIDVIESDYAKSDISNVNTSWITNGIIKNGAITDAMIGSLSANKLTAGTINGSVINVTNLNADNITAGTLNGQRIGEGTLSLDKLSEDVYTEAEVDAKLATMQSEIDGAIETYTGTDIPTLNNTPASSWTTNDEKAKHVGDVYYVVNAGNQADGYCYRFANTGTTANPSYGWILIKDSDVTAALQRLIDAEGDIDGLQSFESTTSSWITETDEEIRLLKGRTTNVETSLGDKVSTSTFNELSQTVDENSASITSLSETVSTKADSSTVTTLSNTVNTVSQKADSNESKITNLTETVSDNEEDIEEKYSDLSQDLSGFKTTVSSTYATQANLNAEINQRKAMYGTSSTAAGTTAKVVTCANFVLYTGARVAVTFSNANTATVPTLNVNSTGAKTIKSFSGADLTEAEYKWAAGSTLEFVYDGEYWRLADEGTLKRLNAAEGTLSIHTTSIEQNTNAIALKANAADVYTKTQTDGLITTEVNNRNAAITASADAINLSVSQTYTTKTEFENLEIGGRNLLKATPKMYNSAAYCAYQLNLTENLKAEETYTIQFWDVNVSHTGRTAEALGIHVYWGGGSVRLVYWTGTSYFTDGHADYLKMTFTVTSTQASGTGAANAWLHIYNSIPSGDGTMSMSIGKWKLELGNKPTDWTPAPEDLEAYTDSAVSAAKTEIKQTTDNISLEVSKKVGSSEIISKINQSAESITIDASKVNIAGTITAINDNTTTTINGGKITTGTLTVGALSPSAQSQVLNSEIEVGGRNLLGGTANKTSPTLSVSSANNTFGSIAGYNVTPSNISIEEYDDSSYALTATETATGNRGAGWYTKPGVLAYGDTVTFSCRVKASLSTSVHTHTAWRNASATAAYTGWTAGGSKTIEADTWTDYSYTFTCASAYPDGEFHVALCFTGNSSGLTWKIAHAKLEKGNKPTDWTPAPEDVDSDISDASKTATSYIVANSTGLMVANMIGSEGQVTPSGITSGRNVLITPTSVDIRNGQTVLASYGDSITIGNDSNYKITLDTTNGLKIGSNVQIDTSGNAYFSGTIYASNGTIGGWNIGSTYIDSTDSSKSTYVLLKNGVYNSSTNPNQDVFVVRNGASGSYTYPFLLRATGEFSVGGGKLYYNPTTSTLSVNGAVTAATGKIGVFNLNNALYTSSNSFGTVDNNIYIGSSGISLGTTFTVTAAGYLTSTSGTIGGWTINNDGLTATNTFSGTTTTITLSSKTWAYLSVASPTDNTETQIGDYYVTVEGNSGSLSLFQNQMRIVDSSNNYLFSVSNAGQVTTRSIELNSNYPYIDFHGGGSSLDYTNRLVATDSNGSFMIQAQASIDSDFNCTLYKSGSYAVRCRVQNDNGYGDLQVMSDKTFGLYARSRSNWLIYVGATGNSVMPLSSDRRIKNYIQDTPTNEAVDLLRSIKVRQFTYKGDENEVVTNGFYAQDIRDHLISKGIGYRPYLNIQSNEEDNESIYYDMKMDEDKVQYGLEYHKLVPELWLGWQYHDTEIDKLKKRITTLELLLIKNNITFD